MNMHFGSLSSLAEQNDVLPLVVIIVLMILLTLGIFFFLKSKKWV